MMKRAPYVARALYSLAPVATSEVETMGVTEGLVLYYNPLFLANEPSFHTRSADGIPNGHEVVGACLYHEVWHILRGLHRMQALPNKELANIAADISINHDLRVANWRLPEWVCYPESFDVPEGLTMEQNYARLKDNKKAQQFLNSRSVGVGLPRDGSGSGKGDQKKQPGKGGKPKPRKGPCSGQCGGIAGNSANKALEKDLDAKYGRHGSEREQIRAATQRDINQHIRAHGRGSTPGFFEEAIEFKKREFPINWRREVALAVQYVSGRVELGGSDFSYARPSKRSILLGVVRPGLIDQLPTFCIVVDSSASMGEVQLNAAKNVIVSVMKKLGVDEVWFFDADTDVKREPMQIRIGDVPHLKAKGRGGTSFILPLERVCKIKPKPDVCVYITDGDGTAPERAPRGLPPLIWCIVPTSYGRKPAGWGKVVVCSNDQKLREPYYG